MTDTQSRFFGLLENYPTLARYWTPSARSPEVNAPSLVRAIEGHLSSGEAAIALCLLGIWFGNGAGYEVDFTDIAALSPDARAPLIAWLQDPFWP